MLTFGAFAQREAFTNVQVLETCRVHCRCSGKSDGKKVIAVAVTTTSIDLLRPGAVHPIQGLSGPEQQGEISW